MLQKLEASFISKDGFDYCQTPNGKSYPSVTTILNATAKGKNKVLAAWRAQIGEDEANQIQEEALERGRILHERIASRLNGQKLTHCPEFVEPWRDSVQPIIKKLSLPSDVQLVEGTVVHPELGYAGKLDCILRWEAQWYIVDWKTAAQKPRQASWLYRYKLQLAAYFAAANQTYLTNDDYKSLSINRALLIIATPNEDAQMFEMGAPEIKRYFFHWMKRIRHYRCLNGENYVVPEHWEKFLKLKS